MATDIKEDYTIEEIKLIAHAFNCAMGYEKGNKRKVLVLKNDTVDALTQKLTNALNEDWDGNSEAIAAATVQGEGEDGEAMAGFLTAISFFEEDEAPAADAGGEEDIMNIDAPEGGGLEDEEGSGAVDWDESESTAQGDVVDKTKDKLDILGSDLIGRLRAKNPAFAEILTDFAVKALDILESVNGQHVVDEVEESPVEDDEPEPEADPLEEAVKVARSKARMSAKEKLKGNLSSEDARVKFIKSKGIKTNATSSQGFARSITMWAQEEAEARVRAKAEKVAAAAE